MIEYSIFQLMKKNGISEMVLIDAGIKAMEIERMKMNLPVNLAVIDKGCAALHCQPGDILTHRA